MARNGHIRYPPPRCRVSWSALRQDYYVHVGECSPTRVEGSDAGRSMRSQAFRTAREDAMREESFQHKGSTAGCSSSWASDTGREFRHGKKHAQPSISNCERRCDASGEFPGASAIWLVVRHGLKYEISNANYISYLSSPPTPPPTSPVFGRGHHAGVAHHCWNRHPPHHHHHLSSVGRGPEAPRRMAWRHRGRYRGRVT